MHWYLLVCTKFILVCTHIVTGNWPTLSKLIALSQVIVTGNWLNWASLETIPQKYSKNSCFPAGCADAAVEDGRSCSNGNTWQWQFGSGKPHLGGLTIKETAERKDAACKTTDKHRNEASGCCRVILHVWK
jgi:hypothetical protein